MNGRSASFGSSPINVRSSDFDWRLEEDETDVIQPPRAMASKRHEPFTQRGDVHDKTRRFSSPFSPQKESPVPLQRKSSPIALPQKGVVSTSPFKHIQNKEKRLVVLPASKTSKNNPSETLEAREVTWPSPVKLPGKRDPEPAINDTSSSTAGDENQVPEPHGSNPLTGESPRHRTSRALRLMRSKKTASPIPPTSNLDGGLNASLEAAKFVMEEEKSSAGSSTASSRSSLSNNELGSIVNRALKLSKGNRTTASKPSPQPVFLPSTRPLKGRPPAPATSAPTQHMGTEATKDIDETSEARIVNRVHSKGKLTQALKRAAVRSQSQDTDHAATPDYDTQSSTQKARPALISAARRTRTVSNVSHQEARLALLNATQKKKEKDGLVKKKEPDSQQTKAETRPNAPETNEVAVKLGLKASRIVAMKNSAKGLANKSEPQDFGGQAAASKWDEAQNMEPHKERINFKKERPYEISTASSVVSTQSFDSAKSRRINHPALVARASPKPGKQTERPFPSDTASETGKTKTVKPFSEELFSSFRHFNASRPSGEADNIASSPGMSNYLDVFYSSLLLSC
jgi:hypothetical protein